MTRASEFYCPGDSHAISPAVHLSRVARGYSACAECVHSSDLGSVPLSDPPSRRPVENRTIFQADRLWALERDPAERERSLEAVAAIAETLWEDAPWSIPATEWDARDHHAPAPPSVCVGHDGSAASLRFSSDVIRLLLRAGCRVISVGRVHAPCLAFAVEHCQTTAGLFIETGESPAGTGVSIVGRDGRPWSLDGRLADVAERVMSLGRPRRSGGSLRTFDAVTPYRAGIPRYFAETFPIDIGVLGISEFTSECWNAVADRCGGRLHPLPGSVHLVDGEPSPRCVRPLMDAILRNRWNGGVILGRDGRQVWAVDRREGLVSSRELCRTVAREMASVHRVRPMRVIAYERTMWMDLNIPGTALSCCPASQESLCREMERARAPFGTDGLGRLWTGSPRPVCDAFQTLGQITRHWSHTQGEHAARHVVERAA